MVSLTGELLTCWARQSGGHPFEGDIEKIKILLRVYGLLLQLLQADRQSTWPGRLEQVMCVCVRAETQLISIRWPLKFRLAKHLSSVIWL